MCEEQEGTAEVKNKRGWRSEVESGDDGTMRGGWVEVGKGKEKKVGWS